MKKDNPTIGLYGIAGVYNYGCEAIVRGTEIILRKKWPDANIKYISIRPQDDKKRLKGCKVEIVPREKYPLFSIPGFGKILAYTVGMPFYPPYDEKTDWLEDCDAVFSIGGDLYTLPSNYEDKSPLYFLNYLNRSNKIPINYNKRLFGNAYNPLIHFGDLVKKNNKKFIIWGASIGPFDKSSYARNIFKTHLFNMDLITSREPETTRYLKSLNITQNVEECADPAFVVSSGYNKYNSHDNIVIGINLSPTSTNQIFNKESKEKILLNQAKVIEELISKFEAEIILIPHVVSDNIQEDDLRYLKSLKGIINDYVADNIKIIDNDPGFINIKSILVNCDILIAARMHCAVNALEAGVPTILVSYSKKSEGMANYIYGNNRWIIPLKNFESNTVLTLVSTMISEKEKLKIFLEKRKSQIKLDAFKPLEKLEKII